jgi:DNA-binding transcriptional ArsR family regulator
VADVTMQRIYKHVFMCLHIAMTASPTRIRAPLPRLDDDQTVQLAEMFRLMGDPTRLRIILACLPGPHAVGDIAASLGLSPSLVSHHLRLLRAARVLRGQRRGKQILYAAADAHVSRVIADMLEHVREPAEHEDE